MEVMRGVVEPVSSGIENRTELIEVEFERFNIRCNRLQAWILNGIRVCDRKRDPETGCRRPRVVRRLVGDRNRCGRRVIRKKSIRITDRAFRVASLIHKVG